MAEKSDRGALPLRIESNCPGCSRELRGDVTYHVYLGEDATMLAFFPVCPECSRIWRVGKVAEKERLFERCGQAIYLEYFNQIAFLQ